MYSYRFIYRPMLGGWVGNYLISMQTRNLRSRLFAVFPSLFLLSSSSVCFLSFLLFSFPILHTCIPYNRHEYKTVEPTDLSEIDTTRNKKPKSRASSKARTKVVVKAKYSNTGSISKKKHKSRRR